MADPDVLVPRLRQVAVVTRDRERVEADLVRLLDARLADRYPGVDQFGLGTAFFTIGNEFFEVVHAAVAGTVADRLIDRRGGDTGFIVMLECAAIEPYVRRAEALGVRVVDTTENDVGRQVQFHPKDTGGISLAVTEITAPGAGADDEPWMYGGPDWRATRCVDRTCGITAAEFACVDAAEVASCWGALLDLPVADGVVPAIALRGGVLRFTGAASAQSAGFVGIDVRTTGEHGTVHVGGLHVALVPTAADDRV